MQVLVEDNKNNPVLIGEAGTGKTAIVRFGTEKYPMEMFQNR